MFKSTLLTSALLLFLGLLGAQDIHYTNYNTSPQNLNPAKNGDFEGTYKIGGIYRDQFSKFFNLGFKSQGLFAEMNIPFGFKESHWVSVGLSLDNDSSGDLGFGSRRIAATGAYHIGFDDDMNNVLTIGVQYANVTRRVDPEKIRTEFLTQSTGGSPDPDAMLLRQNYMNGNRSDINFGIAFDTKLNDKASFEIGTSMYHMSTSRLEAGKIYGDQIPLRFNAHTSLDYRVSKKLSLIPNVYYSKAEEASQLAIQMLGKYWLASSEIDMGLGYRVGDALEIILGYHIKDWYFTGAYDVTVSSASTFNNSVGGFEIGAYKILTKYPKAKIEVIEICPRL